MVQVHAAAFLFDLDGVLIDSTPAVSRVWRNWANEHGFDPDEVIQRAHGRPSISTIREYLPNADAEHENRVVEQCEINDVEGVVPLPGAYELLTSLPRDRWAIVTSCTRPLAEVRIRVAGLPLPDVLVTSSDITRGKPDPEPYLKGAAALGFRPADCVVCEDVGPGIRSGKSAGATVLAFRTTVSDSELLETDADYIVNDCTSIRARAEHGNGLVVSVMPAITRAQLTR
jgi:mannitol-1-/sugar-/sorbitol-6-phosphatase